MSRYVNYGSKVEYVRTETWVSGPVAPVLIAGYRAQHVAEDGHEQLKPREQCECGCLGLGLIP
jgi:hypothetical protein